jgi:hypothetical protein
MAPPSLLRFVARLAWPPRGVAELDGDVALEARYSFDGLSQRADRICASVLESIELQ